MPTETPGPSSINDSTSPSTTEDLTWIDAALIQDALRRGDRADTYARVESLTVARATAPGDNYASVIYKVKAKLEGEAGERSVMVKNLPKGSAVEKSVLESGIFQFEIDMLSKHIPEMKVLLDRASDIRQYAPFAPRCLLHGTAPTPYIVLEDLTPRGFRLADRQRGLGLRHSLLAIRALARFHAASVALLKQEPSIADDFSNPMRGDGETMENFIESGVQLSADACRKCPGLEIFADSLERFKERAMDMIATASDFVKGGFNVILHGDFWTNNMMFKYDESGQPIDIRIVDFQLSHVSSPANDLLFFLNTSLSDSVSAKHERVLLREYHSTLTETLDLFDIRGPTFKLLLAEMDKHSAYALFGALSVWPIARADAIPVIISSPSGESNDNSFMYESDSTKQWLRRVLPEFKRLGWLSY